MPNYNIDVDVIEETTSGLNLDGYNNLTNTYSFLQFSPPPNKDIKFIQGDAVVYTPKTEVLSGLESGRTYYVDPVIPNANQSISKIALYQSANQIGSASTIQVGIGTTTTAGRNAGVGTAKGQMTYNESISGPKGKETIVAESNSISIGEYKVRFTISPSGPILSTVSPVEVEPNNLLSKFWVSPVVIVLL